MNPNNIKIGDVILVEQAWEDEAGNYHDEYARVLNVFENGEMNLDFDQAPESVRTFLREQTDGYMAKDYKPESPTTNPN